MTAKYRRLYYIFNILSVITLMVPLLVAVIMGLNSASPLQAVGITGSMLFAIILTALNFLFKTNLKCYVYFILLALYVAINHFASLLIALAVAAVLDELIFTPLAAKYRQKYIINKEIDARV